MFDFDAMMKQAKKFQREMKDDLQKMAVTSTSGGSAVRVVVNGNKEITNIEFSPDALKDPDILADMVLAAVSGAYTEVEREIASRVPNALGDIDLSAITDMLKK